MFRSLAIAFLLLALPLASCGVRQVSLKADSMREWNDVPIGGVPAHLYLRDRWGLVIAGHGEVLIINNGRSIDCRGMNARDDDAGSGASVHIGNGYWLTAAHCVPGDEVRIVRIWPLTPVVLPARVVWRGIGDNQDVAILHTPSIDPSIPSIELCETPPTSGELLCFGSGLESSAWAAGSITALTPSGDTDFVTLAHTAPLGPGDSGGPAMLPDGRLAGINVTAMLRTTTQHGKAWSIWMNPARIGQIIRDDRDKHTSPAVPRTPRQDHGNAMVRDCACRGSGLGSAALLTSATPTRGE